MITSLSFYDLNCENWHYPDEINTPEERAKFIFLSSPRQGFLEKKDYDEINTTVLAIERAETLSKKAHKNMADSIDNWMQQKKDSGYIEKTWVYVSHLIALIKVEFDILYSTRKSLYTPKLMTLSSDKVIDLWKEVYSKWKNEIESYIYLLNKDYQSPDFKSLIDKKDSRRQKYLDHLLNYAPRKRPSGDSDGEAEFWRAVKNGDLDSIGF